MGDHNASALEAVQGFRHLLLGQVIQSAGGLVEHQDSRFGCNGSGNHQSLALPSGHAAGSFGNDGVHPHGHPADVVGDAGKLGGLPGVVQGQPGGRNGDVGEERFFLAPFLVGGLAGTALGYGIANNNQLNRPPYPIYPPIYYPPYPVYTTNYYY